jgi:hypothetical protein
MGGWTVLYYILKYPPTASTIKIAAEGSEPDIKPPGHGQGYLSRERSREDEKNRVQVAGAFVMCPMVEGGSMTWDIADHSVQAVTSVSCYRVYRKRDKVLCWKFTVRQGSEGERL